MIPSMDIYDLLVWFDQYLAKRHLQFEAVAIGGAALNLLGVVSRLTKDCDILYPEIPRDIAEAARAFAAEVRDRGDTLQDDWLNNGPASLANQLLPQWQERLQALFSGKAIRLRSLGRVDLLCAKLFALCDRGIDLGDCIALAPTTDELANVLSWLEVQDANPDWPAHRSGNTCGSWKEAWSWDLAGLSSPLKARKPICLPRAWQASA